MKLLLIPYGTCRFIQIQYNMGIVLGDFFISYDLAHCNYLDIHISQNIRLCKGDFEGQFQTTLQAKGINFLI